MALIFILRLYANLFERKKKMSCSLPADCLNEVFEILEGDKITLRSCLLVSHLWCEVSVRILWKSVLNCNTLIACLPDFQTSQKKFYVRTELLFQPNFKIPEFQLCIIL